MKASIAHLGVKWDRRLDPTYADELSRVGPSAMARKSRTHAFHDAGHAVMCWCEGVAIPALSLLEEDTGALESMREIVPHCSLDLEQRPKNVSRMQRLVRVWLAGPRAQRRYKPRSHWRADGDHDYRVATSLIGGFTASDRETEAYLHLLEIQTDQELENENLWMRVEAVATALLEAQKLSASKIRSILKDPPISAQRLEQIMKYAMPIPFPDVSRIDVELTEEGPGTHFEARPRGFAWPQTYVGSIHCGNASICGGGLDLGVLIGEMVEDRSTLREIDTSCSGSEAEQACATRFKGSIRLRYVT